MSLYQERELIQAADFKRLQRASLLLEATAFAHGLDTLRVGSRGFTAGSAPSYSQIGFQDTSSLETSRAAVRTGEDRLMRKIALIEANVRVPPSRRYGHRYVDRAIRYAQRFQRGVLIKPRLVEAGPTSRAALKDPDEILAAISDSRQKTGTHATYLVERRMLGREYVFYVVGDQVVSAARTQDRGWREEIYRAGPDGFGAVEPEVLDLALSAFRAFPAMPHGEVHMMCPGATPVADRCVVVSLSPEIGLLRLRQPWEWSARMAQRIIAHAIRDLPVRAGSGKTPVTTEFTMNEVADPDNLSATVQHWFTETGIEGNAYPEDREVTGTMSVTPGEAATFSGVFQTGKLAASRPQTVALHHVKDDS